MVCGVLAGMAPDLDVLIHSAEDPLLFLEYHRQFTHSLVFVPFGAALVSLALWLVFGRSRRWPLRRIFVFCFLGYGTHALLDACTTQLLWPFSDRRFAWNNVSIIDPLVTVPLLGGVVLALFKGRRWPAQLGLSWVLLYLVLGLVARDLAVEEGHALAASRGHEPLRVEAKPSFANILLWKLVYREGERYYVDAVRLGGRHRVYPGSSIAALNLPRDFPWLEPGTLQAVDVERFRWFSMGYLAQDPDNPQRIMDLRYSLLPNEIRPLWSIELDRDSQNRSHVRYLTHRGAQDAPWPRFFAMLRGADLP